MGWNHQLDNKDPVISQLGIHCSCHNGGFCFPLRIVFDFFYQYGMLITFFGSPFRRRWALVVINGVVPFWPIGECSFCFWDCKHRGSHGRFTYIWLFIYGKCRQIYHTWILLGMAEFVKYRCLYFSYSHHIVIISLAKTSNFHKMNISRNWMFHCSTGEYTLYEVSKFHLVQGYFQKMPHVLKSWIFAGEYYGQWMFFLGSGKMWQHYFCNCNTYQIPARQGLYLA